MVTNILQFDEIGYWSEIKLDIIKEYAQAYTRILSTKRLRFSYIDAFAGAGVHLSESKQELVPGSPLNALRINPPFEHYYLIDLNGDRIEQLRNFAEIAGRKDVTLLQGDCNQCLVESVYPRCRYEDYQRALCILDPYGLHLDWEVIQQAGQMKSIDIFLNFPIMDINRNALWRNMSRARKEGQNRLTAFWGDESWKEGAYAKQATLFGDDDPIKLENEQVADAFGDRLRKIAGFKFVPKPIPMRNSTNAIVYYLFFASQQPVAAKIVEDIFDKYKDKRA